MINLIDFKENDPPFVDRYSLLYMGSKRSTERHDITANMTPQQVAQCIAEVFPDNYQLILIIKALGEVKL